MTFGARIPGLASLACGLLLGACENGPPADSFAAESCFVPTVRDPDFATSTPWTTTGGATITPGSAQFTTTSLCDHGAIEQMLSTPPLACGQALVMRMGVALDHGDQLNFAVGVNGAWSSPLLLAGSYTTDVCLGASALGGATHLRLGGGTNIALCPPAPDDEGTWLALGHIAIDVDTTNECPPPGTAPNGDFEAGAQGWSTFGRGGTAEIAEDAGEGGSFAAHLATDRLCEEPAITGRVSLPTSAMVPNLALRIWSKGSSNAIASVRVGPLRPAFLTGSTYIAGTGQATTTDICIPRAAQGTVQPLELAFVATEYTESCADERARDFAFDDISFVSDPACTTDANVFDPGFEQIASATTAAPFWSIDEYDDDPGDDIALPVDATLAHTGDVAAVFTASTPCPHASLSGGVTVPTSVGTAGPALKLWYRSGASTNTGLGVSLGALSAPLTLPAASGWTQVTACLDAHLAGRPDLLRFGLVSTDGGGLCADTFPLETFAVDDVELTTDGSCPAS